MTNEMKYDIECINRLSPYTLKLNEDNVFIFQIQLLDNDIDSDNECFSDQAVYDMSKMFLGKMGFCDGSKARIFRTWVEPKKRKTKDERDYIGSLSDLCTTTKLIKYHFKIIDKHRYIKYNINKLRKHKPDDSFINSV